MLSIQQPQDLISISIHNVLSYRKDEAFYELVKSFNKTIIINVTEFYPVIVKFNNGEITFEKGDMKKADLKVSMSIHTMLDLAYGRLGVVMAFLTRKMKIKGILKVGTLLKFQKIFLKSMKMVAAEENVNYYDHEAGVA